METTALAAGERERADITAELRSLKEEERSEEAQAQALVSKSENLKQEFARERDSMVRQLEARLMAERERESQWLCTRIG